MGCLRAQAIDISQEEGGKGEKREEKRWKKGIKSIILQAEINRLF